LTGKETLKSFQAISGEEGELVYNKGMERILENWYRRPMPYGFADCAVDLLAWSTKFPELLRYRTPHQKQTKQN
jgi:hypothetical protein